MEKAFWNHKAPDWNSCSTIYPVYHPGKVTPLLWASVSSAIKWGYFSKGAVGWLEMKYKYGESNTGQSWTSANALFSKLATHRFCFGTESRSRYSLWPQRDPQERMRIRWEKADLEGYSGKENELEAPGGQRHWFNELPNFWINELIVKRGEGEERKIRNLTEDANRYI